MKNVLKIRKQLASLTYIQLVAIQTTIGLLLTLVLVAVLSIFKIGMTSNDESNGLSFAVFVLYQVINGVLETILFQYLPYRITAIHTRNPQKPYVNIHPTRYVIVSSILFGFMHFIGTHWEMPFCVLKVLCSMLVGVVLSVSFYILFKKKQKPILSVALIHFLINVIIGLTGCFFQK